MKTLIRILLQAISENLQGNLSFPSLEDVDINNDDLNDLAGNILIDYNDSFDDESEANEIFWDTYLKPIHKLLTEPNYK